MLARIEHNFLFSIEPDVIVLFACIAFGFGISFTPSEKVRFFDPKAAAYFIDAAAAMTFYKDPVFC